MSKQAKRLTKREKKELYKTPANLYQARRKKLTRVLNHELNKVTLLISENTKDLDPKFSQAVDEYFWDLT